MPPIAVYQRALRGGPHQGLKFVLPVDVDQHTGGAAEHLQRYRLSAQPGTAASVAADHTPQQQLLILRYAVLIEQLPQFLARTCARLRGG